MTISRHAEQRMNQRGIPLKLVEFALEHGRVEGDRHVLDRRESSRLIAALQEQLRLAHRVLDKGGVAVVEENGRVITTYNVEPACPRPRHRKEHFHD